MTEGMSLPADMTRVRGDCGVIVVAVAAGITRAHADGLFRALCERIRCKKRWHGGTTLGERLTVLDALGVSYTVEKLPRMTLQAFIAKHAKHDARYMVTVTGHVLITRNWVALDQHGRRPIFTHPARRKRVTSVLKLMESHQ